MVQRYSKTGTHVGQRLRERREASGMSQEALAGRLGVSTAELSLFEAGAKPIPPQRLIQAAEALKTPLGGLLEEPPEAGCGHDLSPASRELICFLAMPEAYALVSAFIAIPCERRRRDIVDKARRLGQPGVADMPVASRDRASAN